MTPKKETIAERAKRGDYDLVPPLDYILLGELQAEGTTLAGLYEIGTTAKEIHKKHPALSSNSIATRLRLMKSMGLTKQVRLVGGGHAAGRSSWQRTIEGERVLNEWRSNANS